jgi:hypothetical protein
MDNSNNECIEKLRGNIKELELFLKEGLAMKKSLEDGLFTLKVSEVPKFNEDLETLIKGCEKSKIAITNMIGDIVNEVELGGSHW